MEDEKTDKPKPYSMDVNQMFMGEANLVKSVGKSAEVLNVAKYLYYRAEIFLSLQRYEDAYMSFAKV